MQKRTTNKNDLQRCIDPTPLPHNIHRRFGSRRLSLSLAQRARSPKGRSRLYSGFKRAPLARLTPHYVIYLRDVASILIPLRAYAYLPGDGGKNDEHVT